MVDVVRHAAERGHPHQPGSSSSHTGRGVLVLARIGTSRATALVFRLVRGSGRCLGRRHTVCRFPRPGVLAQLRLNLVIVRLSSGTFCFFNFSSILKHLEEALSSITYQMLLI